MLSKDSKYLYIILLACGFIYARSSYGKLTGGTFVSSLAATLSKVAPGNPYTQFKSFLTGIAIPNSYFFGTLTMWGEFLTAVTLIICPIYLFFNPKANKLWYLALALGSVGGMFLNAIFWLAFGYTSPSTDGLNLLMFVAEAAGLAFALNKYTSPSSK